MPDWTQSMEQTFEYYMVDPGSWCDKTQLTDVIQSNIEWDSDADTLGSATFDMSSLLGECYIRVYLITIQNEIKEKFPMGTFLVQTPKSNFDGRYQKVSIDAYTPLLELKENPPPIGYSILKGGNVMSNAYKILRDNMRAPVVETTATDKLYNDFVANTSDSWLTFTKDLVANAKYNLGLDEMGRVIFLPDQDAASLQPVWTYTDDNSSILYPDISLEHDIYGIPNVVEVLYSGSHDNYYARVVNDDPNSPTWIQNGIIKDGSIGSAAIHDGAITNVKIADASIEAAKIKSINADTITAGTIKTDRLIITGPDGEDSIVKAINLANGVSEADVNSQKIQAASIDVIDLSAFKAKIAGFDMNGNAIYSGKESIKDPTSGIYISTTGIGMGDGALTGKNESPLQAYADGSFKLIGKNSFFDFNTVTGELNIESSSFKVASKSVATKDDIDDVRDEITTFLSIESSKGTAFKNNSVSTILSVIIYHGKDRVEDPERMREVFGFSAYLQWYWQRLDDEAYGVISSTDSRLRNEGFQFVLSPDDVDVKTDFRCELIA